MTFTLGEVIGSYFMGILTATLVLGVAGGLILHSLAEGWTKRRR